MKSIKTHLLLVIIAMALVPSALIGIFSGVINYTTAIDDAKTQFTTVLDISLSRIEYQLASYLNVAETAGCNPAFTSEEYTAQEKEDIITKLVAHEGFERGNLLDANGDSMLPSYAGTNFADRDYFQKAMNGESFISDLIESKIDGDDQTYVIAAAPVWADGIYGSTIEGVIFFVPSSDFLNEIMDTVDICEEGRSYILDTRGTTIGAEDRSSVNTQNLLEYTKNNSNTGYEDLAAIHQKAIRGETDVEIYKDPIAGETVIGYAKIPAHTNGWFLVMEAPLDYFIDTTILIIIITLILAVVCTVSGIFIAIISSNRIVKPIRACSDRLRTLALGDLSTPTYETKAKDETGVLAKSTADLVKNLNRMISDIERILSAMADGKLNVDTEQNANAYIGDFSELIIAAKRINKELSHAMGRIDVAAEQVSAGSDQVSSGAQGLSQGATEQASSIEELAATITEISTKTEENLADCIKAKESVDETAHLMSEANSQMQNLIVAMSRIGDASEKIEKIIKSIEDIAFNTNILALNAAVEAAKAGEAGKGFAVVAEEVRNLAAKSQEAVKSTSALIGESSDAVQDGTRIANETAKTLEKVVAASAQVNEIVAKVAESSDMQAISIQQVTVGIDQISSVVQNNSATAQESAAASEELNSQAQLLKTLVERFEITPEGSDIELE